MPSADTSKPISWADQVEDGDMRSIPLPEEYMEGDLKKMIEYKRDDDGKLIKITRTIKIEKRKASKSIARRKQWAKYGQSASDPPGPNPGTTAIVQDEVSMTFVSNKDNENRDPMEDQMEKMKMKRIMVCRVCKGDHWTTKCPYKDSLEPLQRELLQSQGETTTTPDTAAAAAGAKPDAAKPGVTASVGKYIPPAARDGAKRKGETMHSRRQDEAATIRVTNLSEDTRDSDLEDLFRPFGAIQRIYLAQDKVTGNSKGFAFINFYNREHAAKAISRVSGFGYDHLILKVEWAKPSGHQH
ncbi:eukaryotic translation initiation factor 3 subunit G-like isoform X1 [Diadema setosum]|uniref:eukaryotic translation initiation factor 3 subunit G-like isoform X1 n=1 Tax=Diadema setosum TaxID=31175 RepID=UPI003B3A3AD1